MTLSGAHGNGNDGETTSPKRILVVDDDEVTRDLLTELLTQDGHEVISAGDGHQAIELLEENSFGLVITDLVMPGKKGMEVMCAAKRIDPRCPVIVITAYPSEQTVFGLMRHGASDYFVKPLNLGLVKVTVAELLRRRRP